MTDCFTEMYPSIHVCVLSWLSILLSRILLTFYKQMLHLSCELWQPGCFRYKCQPEMIYVFNALSGSATNWQLEAVILYLRHIKKLQSTEQLFSY